jgi:hypothetical protein
MPWADLPDEVLETLRGNLLRGLDRVAEHVDAGTLRVVRKGGTVPPSEFGWLFVVLLRQVEAERAGRVVVPSG